MEKFWHGFGAADKDLPDGRFPFFRLRSGQVLNDVLDVHFSHEYFL